MIILFVFEQHINHNLIDIFAEVKNDISVDVVFQFLSSIYGFQIIGKIMQHLHIIFDGLNDFIGMFIHQVFTFIKLQLSFENIYRSAHICESVVGIREFFLTIKTQRSFERTRFHFIKNALHINDSTTINLKLQADTVKLFHQHWNIKTRGIIPCEVSIANKIK